MTTIHPPAPPADAPELWPHGGPIAIRRVDHDLSVVIPAFNEEGRLPWTLAELGAFLDDWKIDYRVIVVDDGSTDGTAALTAGLGPRYRTIRHARQCGKGRAVRTAMLRATGRVAAFTDADLPYELEALRRGFQWIDGGQCEAVFGARDMAESVHSAPRHPARQLATLAFRQIAKLLISRRVTDTQCGLKLFSRRAALEIFARATVDGFAFDAEVVLLAERLGLPLRRLPVNLINDYASSLSLRRSALPMLWDVVRLRLRDTLGRPRPAPRFSFESPDDLPADDSRRLAA